MTCSVSKNSSSTVSLRAEKLQNSSRVFKDFAKWDQLYHNKNTQTDNNKKAYGLSCPDRVLMDIHYWQVKPT